VTLTGVAFGTGQYQYLPSRCRPASTASTSRSSSRARPRPASACSTSAARSTPRSSGPNGFRGIYGEERGEFFVATDSRLGRLPPRPGRARGVDGPRRRSSTPAADAVHGRPCTMSAVPAGRRSCWAATWRWCCDEAGWYRGDLHAHTPQSSDAFKSGSALTPAQWADECRRIGLDFLALTDHNVVTQNFAIADTAGRGRAAHGRRGDDQLFYGHATVSGITRGVVRLAPAAGRRADGTTRPPLRARSSSSSRPRRPAAPTSRSRTPSAPRWPGASSPRRRRPRRPHAGAGGLDRARSSPTTRPRCGPGTACCCRGQRIVANGGSDLHGTRERPGLRQRYADHRACTPTRCRSGLVVAALKAGRSFVTRLPDGVELYLTATGVDGQRQIMGGTVSTGAPTDVVEFEVLVRRRGACA
jgi:hypothetical protein